MSSIGVVKDDTSDSTRGLNIAFIVLYSGFWGYSAFQLYRLRKSSVLFQLIHSLILVFLSRTAYLVRIIFWFDIVFDYRQGVYFTLQSSPNFILYNIGQVFCYAW